MFIFSKILLNFIFEKFFGEFLKFLCKLFYKFLEIFFQNSFMSTFSLNVFSEPKFWRRHCSTGREEFMYEILSDPPPLPKPKSWRRHCEIDIQYMK